MLKAETIVTQKTYIMPFQMYLNNICNFKDEGAPVGVQDFSSESLTAARAYIYRVIKSYWTRICRNFTDTPPEIPPLPNCLDTLVSKETECNDISASDFARKLPSHYSLHSAYTLTGKYASLLPPDTRSKYGIFYTPPSLTERLLSSAGKQGVNWRHCTVLDPACGGGAFLAPVALRKQEAMPEASSKERIRIIGESLLGFEIDPFAGWLSQVLTELALINDVINSEERLPTIFKTCDALRSPVEPSSFDLVVGNPPYGRTKLSEEDRSLYQRSLYGHANLYGLFTDLALRVAKPGGIIALVTPASYLAGQYFKNLRKTIRQLASPRQIDFVEKRNGTFDGVLQETVLSIHVKRQNPNVNHKTNVANVLKLQNNGFLKTEVAGKIYLPKKKGRPLDYSPDRTCGETAGPLKLKQVSFTRLRL
mgnify:CR=1 FL=1